MSFPLFHMLSLVFHNKTIQSFSEGLSVLDRIVRRMVVESPGLVKYMEEHMNSTNYMPRVKKYKGPQTAGTKLGLTSHTDKNIAWTNCWLHSPHHRVMMSGNDARYLAGLFSVPKARYIIKALDEMVDDDLPLLFKPFDHIEFMRFYYREGVQRFENPLKTYCGV